MISFLLLLDGISVLLAVGCLLMIPATKKGADTKKMLSRFNAQVIFASIALAAVLPDLFYRSWHQEALGVITCYAIVVAVLIGHRMVRRDRFRWFMSKWI